MDYQTLKRLPVGTKIELKINGSTRIHKGKISRMTGAAYYTKRIRSYPQKAIKWEDGTNSALVVYKDFLRTYKFTVIE